MRLLLSRLFTFRLKVFIYVSKEGTTKDSIRLRRTNEILASSLITLCRYPSSKLLELIFYSKKILSFHFIGAKPTPTVCRRKLLLDFAECFFRGENCIRKYPRNLVSESHCNSENIEERIKNLRLFIASRNM